MIMVFTSKTTSSHYLVKDPYGNSWLIDCKGCCTIQPGVIATNINAAWIRNQSISSGDTRSLLLLESSIRVYLADMYEYLLTVKYPLYIYTEGNNKADACSKIRGWHASVEGQINDRT